MKPPVGPVPRQRETERVVSAVRPGDADKFARRPPTAPVTQHPEQQQETKPAEPNEERARKPPKGPVPQEPEPPDVDPQPEEEKSD